MSDCIMNVPVVLCHLHYPILAEQGPKREMDWKFIGQFVSPSTIDALVGEVTGTKDAEEISFDEFSQLVPLLDDAYGLAEEEGDSSCLACFFRQGICSQLIGCFETFYLGLLRRLQFYNFLEKLCL